MGVEDFSVNLNYDLSSQGNPRCPFKGRIQIDDSPIKPPYQTKKIIAQLQKIGIKNTGSDSDGSTYFTFGPSKEKGYEIGMVIESSKSMHVRSIKVSKWKIRE